jgi:hypothetical protein
MFDGGTWWLSIWLIGLVAFGIVGIGLRFVGVIASDGESLGGGLVYPRAALREGEVVEEELAECGTSWSLYGRLFSTSQRLIHLPSRSWFGGRRGKPRFFELSEIETTSIVPQAWWGSLLWRPKVRIVTPTERVDLWPFFGCPPEVLEKRIQSVAGMPNTAS